MAAWVGRCKGTNHPQPHPPTHPPQTHPPTHHSTIEGQPLSALAATAARTPAGDASAHHLFMLVLSVCHTVVLEELPGGKTAYQVLRRMGIGDKRTRTGRHKRDKTDTKK